MATPVSERPEHKQYLGDSDSDHMEVHDLDNEDSRPNGCQIDEIIEAGNAVVFSPDSLEQAESEGYDRCDKCLPGSTR